MRAVFSRTSGSWDEAKDGPRETHIYTLGELIDFIRREGQVVVDVEHDVEYPPNPDYDPAKPWGLYNSKVLYREIPGTEHLTIEIYDDYRE